MDERDDGTGRITSFFFFYGGVMGRGSRLHSENMMARQRCLCALAKQQLSRTAKRRQR